MKRECYDCKKKFISLYFSKTQWKKPFDHDRICKNCVYQKNKKNQYFRDKLNRENSYDQKRYQKNEKNYLSLNNYLMIKTIFEKRPISGSTKLVENIKPIPESLECGLCHGILPICKFSNNQINKLKENEMHIAKCIRCCENMHIGGIKNKEIGFIIYNN